MSVSNVSPDPPPERHCQHAPAGFSNTGISITGAMLHGCSSIRRSGVSFWNRTSSGSSRSVERALKRYIIFASLAYYRTQTVINATADPASAVFKKMWGGGKRSARFAFPAVAARPEGRAATAGNAREPGIRVLAGQSSLSREKGGEGVGAMSPILRGAASAGSSPEKAKYWE